MDIKILIDPYFSHDAILISEDYLEILGELSLREKNRISHRYKALKGLLAFLQIYSKSFIS